MTTSFAGHLVCFALATEAAPFRRTLKHRPGVRILLTGVGPGNAQRSIAQALSHARPAMVLTCGFAGGLDPALPPEAVLFSADEHWPYTESLIRAGARPGRFHSTPRIVSTAIEKRQLRHATGADAVDMESEVIRQQCHDAGIPSATVRVISDTANEDLPLDFNRFMTADQRLRYGRLLVAVLMSPRTIGPLLKLQRRSRRAAQVLGTTLAQTYTSTTDVTP